MQHANFVASLALAGLVVTPVSAAEITVLSGGAVKSPLTAVLPGFEKTSGHKVKVIFTPARDIAYRVSVGEVYDLLIVPIEAIEGYEHLHKISPGTHTPLGKVGIGVAVNERAPTPDISTPEALKQTLLAATSVVYMHPARGTSGKYFAQVLEELGITTQVNRKTQFGTGGYIVEPVGQGKIELGVHQITEILPVDGVKLVGPLPPPLQKWTTYTVVPMVAAPSPDLARDLVKYLRSDESVAVFERKGLAAP